MLAFYPVGCRDGPLPASNVGVRLECRRQPICLGCVPRAAGNRRRVWAWNIAARSLPVCLGRAIDRLGNCLWVIGDLSSMPAGQPQIEMPGWLC